MNDERQGHEESRRSERSDLFMTAGFRPYNSRGEYSLGISRDFSEGGFSFESQGYDIETGTVLEFKLTSPKFDKSFIATGKVVWKKESWYARILGIEFVEMDRGDIDEILKLKEVRGIDKTSNGGVLSAVEKSSKKPVIAGKGIGSSRPSGDGTTNLSESSDKYADDSVYGKALTAGRGGRDLTSDRSPVNDRNSANSEKGYRRYAVMAVLILGFGVTLALAGLTMKSGELSKFISGSSDMIRSTLSFGDDKEVAVDNKVEPDLVEEKSLHSDKRSETDTVHLSDNLTAVDKEQETNLSKPLEEIERAVTDDIVQSANNINIGEEIDPEIMRKNIRFDRNSITVATEDYLTIDMIATFLKEHENTVLRLDGHTDNIGSEEYNLELSAIRAESVKKLFIQRGVNASRIILRGHGSTKPAYSNDNPDERMMNRRVELRIEYYSAYKDMGR